MTMMDPRRLHKSNKPDLFISACLLCEPGGEPVSGLGDLAMDMVELRQLQKETISPHFGKHIPLA